MNENRGNDKIGKEFKAGERGEIKERGRKVWVLEEQEKCG